MFFQIIFGVTSETRKRFLSPLSSWKNSLIAPTMQYPRTKAIPMRKGMTKGSKPDAKRSIISHPPYKSGTMKGSGAWC